MTTAPKTPTTEQTDDKMSWLPDDVQWTKKPSAAQRLAAASKSRQQKAPKPKTN